MNKLEKAVKRFNLLYTNTLDKKSLLEDDFNLVKENINYEDCISLYDVIYTFNKIHNLFKKEYEELEKFELGKEVNILDFNKLGEKTRVLDMVIYKPNMVSEKYVYLYMREINGVSMPIIAYERGSFHSDNGSYRQPVKLNAKVVKKYLNLFEKYQPLLDLYNHLQKEAVFNDGSNLLLTKIDSENNNFLDDMDSFFVSMDSNFLATAGDHIKIRVNLGDKLSIDLEDSGVYLDGKEANIDNETYLKILKNIFVKSEYLEKKNKKKANEEKSKSKILVNNI